MVPLSTSYGEEHQILITLSSKMDEIIFDGKWTQWNEWKPTSLDTLHGGSIQLRTAHQENFVYIFVDVLSDTILSKGSDKATVCFDTDHDRTQIPKNDDYCFIAILGKEQGYVIQGGSKFVFNNYYEKIEKPDGFIAIGNISDSSDRYSKVPHASYEFRIPTDLIGRSNEYGFYLLVFDADTNKFYSWPENIYINDQFEIPSPNFWGEIISIDNSLPELHFPFLVLLVSFMVIIIGVKKK